jgi:hypothetical protein
MPEGVSAGASASARLPCVSMELCEKFRMVVSFHRIPKQHGTGDLGHRISSSSILPSAFLVILTPLFYSQNEKMTRIEKSKSRKARKPEAGKAETRSAVSFELLF